MGIPSISTVGLRLLDDYSVRFLSTAECTVMGIPSISTVGLRLLDDNSVRFLPTAECTVMGIPSISTNLSGFGCLMIIL